jgi:hypothetical protein
MTDRFYAGFVNAAYVGVKSPTAPTSAVANKGNTTAEISFSAASSIYSPVTSYRATSTPGNFTGTAASSPVTVTGLTNGVSYTFQVTAINAFGEGPGSNVTNAIIPSLEGQRLYTEGSFTFIVPIGITSVSVVCVGGGGAGGYYSQGAGAGGGLRYKNNIAVTPGQSIAVTASNLSYYGGAGGISSFGTNGTDAFYFFAGGGASNSGGTQPGGTGSTIGGAADGGGNGGSSNYFAGGGAGGYSGNGGSTTSAGNGQAGSGGGGGSGYGVTSNYPPPSGAVAWSGSGGGVGVLGAGASGNAGTGSSENAVEASKQGQGGSGGTTNNNTFGSNAGYYGGGGGGSYGATASFTQGSPGAVRIIYPASGGAVSPRVFPSTNTGDV